MLAANNMLTTQLHQMLMTSKPSLVSCRLQQCTCTNSITRRLASSRYSRRQLLRTSMPQRQSLSSSRCRLRRSPSSKFSHRSKRRPTRIVNLSVGLALAAICNTQCQPGACSQITAPPAFNNSCNLLRHKHSSSTIQRRLQCLCAWKPAVIRRPSASSWTTLRAKSCSSRSSHRQCSLRHINKLFSSSRRSSRHNCNRCKHQSGTLISNRLKLPRSPKPPCKPSNNRSQHSSRWARLQASSSSNNTSTEFPKLWQSIRV